MGGMDTAGDKLDATDAVPSLKRIRNPLPGMNTRLHRSERTLSGTSFVVDLIGWSIEALSSAEARRFLPGKRTQPPPPHSFTVHASLPPAPDGTSSRLATCRHRLGLSRAQIPSLNGCTPDQWAADPAALLVPGRRDWVAIVRYDDRRFSFLGGKHRRRRP